MYTTLFLSMIPTIVETLTRLPISHPSASDPAAPVIKMAQFVLIAVYLGGVAYQLLKLKKTKRLAPSADSSVKLT